MPFNRTAAMRALHALGKKNGYDHDDLRDLAASHFGIARDKVSISKLTDSQLGALCGSLKNHGTKPAPISNKATTRQIWKINEYMKLMSWDQARMNGFIQRQCKKSDMSDISKQDAVKVIDGLKNLHERGTYSRQ